MNLRLLGAPTIKDIVPEMVDAHNIHSHVVAVPGDRLYDANCEACSRLTDFWQTLTGLPFQTRACSTPSCRT